MMALVVALYGEIASAQIISPSLITALPAVVSETSGLEATDSLSIWTHNDSGANNELFKVDLSGNVIQTISIPNATNTDWEDLAQDDSGNFYIGDFGNNSNDRTDLKIYKIHDPDNFVSGQDTAQIISFSYPDQLLFPPPSGNLNFDCEAFLHFGDSLYLFSKNISNPSSGYSKMYRLPDQPGNYMAELLDSFYTEDPVTSADIEKDGKTMILLTYLSVIAFTAYSGTDFFSGLNQKIAFAGITQKEAVLFKDTNSIFITDEEIFGIGGNLYEADLGKWLSDTPVKNSHNFFFTYPNPSTGQFTVCSAANLRGASYTIADPAGRVVSNGILHSSPLQIESDLPSGLYLLSVIKNDLTYFSLIEIAKGRF